MSKSWRRSWINVSVTIGELIITHIRYSTYATLMITKTSKNIHQNPPWVKFLLNFTPGKKYNSSLKFLAILWVKLKSITDDDFPVKDVSSWKILFLFQNMTICSLEFLRVNRRKNKISWKKYKNFTQNLRPLWRQ